MENLVINSSTPLSEIMRIYNISDIEEAKCILRDLIVIEVSNSYIDGANMRDIAGIYGISVWSVQNYLSVRLKELDPKKYELVREIREGKKPLTFDTPEIRNRVLNIYQLIKMGHSLEEVTKILLTIGYDDITINVVYRDMVFRLKKMDYDKYEEIKSIFDKRRMQNLKQRNRNKV